MKRFFSIFLSALFLMLWGSPSSAFAQEIDTASDISRETAFECEAKGTAAYLCKDNDYLTFTKLNTGDQLTIRSKSGKDIGYLYVRFGKNAQSFTIQQYGIENVLLKESVFTVQHIADLIPLENGCQRLALISGTDSAELVEIKVYGNGAPPEAAHIWEDQVERADFLVITTHPDDECLFLGGIYPIYGGQQGLVGTYAFITTPCYGRLHEALNGLWITGLRTYPYFLHFPDIYKEPKPPAENTDFRQEDVALSFVRLYRKIKPLVVVTQDPIKGEYGHWQHIIGANAAYDAVLLAADPSYDPESVEQYGVWEVKKLYQHIYPENRILLDVTSPLDAYDGKNAVEIATAAFNQHVSQIRSRHRPKANTGTYNDIDAFGLSYSAVGEDVNGNDMFENIDHTWLAASIANPTPEPTLEPTPTPVLTPKPTNTPQIASIPDVSDVKTTNDFDIGKFLPFILSGIILLLFVGISIGVSIHSKKR